MNKTSSALGYLLIAAVSGGAGYLLFQGHIATDSTATAQLHKDARASLVGMIRPDFSLPDLDGRRHGPGEWSGKVLVLNFWATWCPPCLKEIPGFIRLQDKYADRNVQFVGIALQQAEEVRDFVVSRGINYPILAGETDVIRVAEQYGNRIGTLPYTVIVDRAQRIAFIKRGPLFEAEADTLISTLAPAD